MAEDARIRRIEELSDGGQVIYERTESTVNEKTGLTRTVTEKRLNPGDWRGHAYVLDRADRLGALRAETRPTGARPAEGQGGPIDVMEIWRRAYELAHAPSADPRALRRPRSRGRRKRSRDPAPAHGVLDRPGPRFHHLP